MKFNYQLKRDLEKPTQSSLNLIRALGAFFVISGVISLIGLSADQSKLKLILYTSQIIIGLFQMFFPKMAGKRFVIHDEIINIDDKVISWKLNKKDALQILEIEHIDDVKFFIGEVHFETNNNETYKLSSHKIQNKAKYEEFLRIIRIFKTELNEK